MTTLPFSRHRIALVCASLLASPAVWAADAVAAPGDKPSTQAQTADKTNPEKPPADDRKKATLNTVVVTGGDETDARRQSTAAKIIVGREEIAKFGDTSTSELLKRLPGVTVGGAPGRGGAPSMRGLGGGYTQILIDGERPPTGFSLDSLNPDQIERIEVLRGATAETGTRAIGGTINIVTRGGYKKYFNNVNVAVGFENGNAAPNVSWARNDVWGNLTYNTSVSAGQNERDNDYTGSLITENLTSGQVFESTRTFASTSKNQFLNGNARLQWALKGGDTLLLMPMLVRSESDSVTTGRFRIYNTTGLGQAASADIRFNAAGNTTVQVARLGSTWTHKTADGAKLTVNANVASSQFDNTSTIQTVGSTLGANGVFSPTTTKLRDRTSRQTETNALFSGKYAKSLGSGHNLVGGVELENKDRNETATELQDGESPLTEFDGDLKASVRRTAVYLQDEWTLNPHWNAHLGVRWEGISTEGSVASTGFAVKNNNAVTTPVLHAVWKPKLASRDQVRMSLTRTYRAPNLGDFIAQPQINPFYLTRGANIEKFPDRAGNSDLKPELATGLDVAYEHYLPGNGLVSANVFYRKVNGLIRTRTEREIVSWADEARWVTRRRNVGEAATVGVELDAKLRLSDVVKGAPKVDLRANLSLFQSHVDGIPGPDNRLERQPDGTMNVGADYAVSGLPLKIGGNLNYTPAYSTTLTADQSTYQGDRIVADAYAEWQFNPKNKLRVSASNMLARDYVINSTRYSTNAAGDSLRDTSPNSFPTYVNVQVRWELKL